MKTFITFICFSVWIQLAIAQSVSPQVVASAGGYATAANISLSFTVGEPAITTLTSANNILTQGFQQPTDVVSGLLDEEKQAEGTVSLYPVPASNSLWCGYQFPKEGNVSVAIYNSLGQVLDNTLSEQYQSGKSIHAIDVSKYASGIYLIIVKHNNGIVNNVISKQFQITH